MKPSTKPQILEEIFNIYPKRKKGLPMGKASGMRRLMERLKVSDLKSFRAAVIEYRRLVDIGEVGRDYIMMWSTFAGRWDDYLPENLSEGFEEDESDLAGMIE